MKTVRDIHLSFSNIIGFGIVGLVWSIADTRWWSCSNSSEQILHNWVGGVTMVGLGLIATIFARHYGHAEKLRYYVELAVRGMLIYALVTVAMIKTEGQFYDLSLITQNHKLSDLNSDTFAAAFYGYSPFFQSYSGALLLVGLAMLIFRQTMRLGSIILAAALINAVVINHSFESCFLMKNSIYLSAVGYLLWNDIFAIAAFVTKTKPLITYYWTPFSPKSHIYRSFSMFKLVCLIGLMFYNHDYILDIKNYQGRNKDNPIAGVWNVDSVNILASDLSEDDTKELIDFDRIIIDKDRFGAVSVDDSLSYFEFVVNPKDHQLEFWNFYDYRTLDIKGRYQQIAPDTLLYIGRNNRDSIEIVLTLDKK